MKYKVIRGGSWNYTPKLARFTFRTRLNTSNNYYSNGGFRLLNTLQTKGETQMQSPIETVAIPGADYQMGKFQVTQRQWLEVMGDNPSYFKGDLDNPVESVSYKNAKKFIKKLNKLTGETYRLPTEQEWEYCAKAGEDFEYSGSDNPDEVAWYIANSGGTTHPVGKLKPNAFGLYDMSGNVWEWTKTTWK